jgi:hypothetical protein
MKIRSGGQGAFGVKHLEGIKPASTGIEVVSLAGGRAESTKAVAEKYGIPHWTTDLAESARAAGRRGGDPRDADADARRASRTGDARRQARRSRDSDRRLAGRCRSVCSRSSKRWA